MLTADHLATLRSGLVPGALWPHLLAPCVPVHVRPLVCAGVVWAVGSDLWPDALVTIGLVPRGERGRVFRAPIADLDIVLDAAGRAHVARLMAVGLDGVRPPAPAWHILPSGETATPLPPEWAPHAPALLACHVARVAAGLPGVRRALPPWEQDGGASYRMATYTKWACEVTADGWACSSGWSHGPETGPAGMAAADAAALAAGFALMNAGGPVLPWPDLGGSDAR